MLRVMRSAGGLGEALTGRTQGEELATTAVSGRLGKREATWPSGPTPSKTRSMMGRPSEVRGRTSWDNSSICPA